VTRFFDQNKKESVKIIVNPCPKKVFERKYQVSRILYTLKVRVQQTEKSSALERIEKQRVSFRGLFVFGIYLPALTKIFIPRLKQSANQIMI